MWFHTAIVRTNLHINMKTYRYLYYQLYRIWLKKKDEVENARINAVLTLTFSLCINIINIPLILLVLLKTEIIRLSEIDANEYIFIPIVFLVGGIFNYLLLARKKQHKKIIEEFKSECEAKRKRGMMFTILYLVMSIGIPLYIAFFTTP